MKLDGNSVGRRFSGFGPTCFRLSTSKNRSAVEHSVYSVTDG